MNNSQFPPRRLKKYSQHCHVFLTTAITDIRMSEPEITGRDDGHILKSDEKDPVHHKASLDAGVIEVTSPTFWEKSDHNSNDGEYPTEEEKQTLRRVAGPISWAGYMLCFVEGANNASYFGVTGIFANYIQRPLPKGGNGWVSRDSSITDYFTYMIISRALLPKVRRRVPVLSASASKLRRPLMSCSLSSPIARPCWAVTSPTPSLAGTRYVRQKAHWLVVVTNILLQIGLLVWSALGFPWSCTLGDCRDS